MRDFHPHPSDGRHLVLATKQADEETGDERINTTAGETALFLLLPAFTSSFCLPPMCTQEYAWSRPALADGRRESKRSRRATRALTSDPMIALGMQRPWESGGRKKEEGRKGQGKRERGKSWGERESHHSCENRGRGKNGKRESSAKRRQRERIRGGGGRLLHRCMI